jgi:IS1 family transposase
MNRLNLAKRTNVIAHLVEGNSLAATARLTGVSPNTVMHLADDVGSMCAFYLWKHMVRLPSKRIEIDEIWSFVLMKEKRVPARLKGMPGYGDTWVWVAFDPDTKLVPCFHIGRRDTAHAKIFVNDLADRLRHRVQLTSDGHNPYLEAVEEAFGGAIDYGRLVKEYGGFRVFKDGTRKKCAASECSSTRREVICGKPDPDLISTSLIERQNLTMRMSMRRFTRESNGFSKKLQNHRAAIALHFMHYNFVRQHSTLRVTPAMEAGLAKSFWSIEDLVRLAD